MSGTLISTMAPEFDVGVDVVVDVAVGVVAGVDAAVAVVTAPSSSSNMTTSPSEILSPTFTLTSFTIPACDEGTSIVALSDSSVTSDCSFSTRSPALM